MDSNAKAAIKHFAEAAHNMAQGLIRLGWYLESVADDEHKKSSPPSDESQTRHEK